VAFDAGRSVTRLPPLSWPPPPAACTNHLLLLCVGKVVVYN